MQFECYYDEYMMQWTVRNTETLVMYPCTSENMANEFTKLLNELDDKYIGEFSLRETLQQDLQRVEEENKHLKQELKRCKEWINSDKNDYELTLAFIKNKGYSLKDVLEYEKELKSE